MKHMILRSLLPFALLTLAAAQNAAPPAPKVVLPAPVQPIPFSHRTHSTTAQLDCKSCHPVPEPGESATIPETSKCMACHGTIKKDSPAIQRLAEFHGDHKPVPWRRVYRIPDYVFFSHKQHLAKGATCETCHGAVRDQDVLRKEKDLSMAGCMECHRAAAASLACDFCHEKR
jgi:hypothetical protein